MEILITQEQIQQRVRELATLISTEHEQSGNAMPIVMIGLLNGAIHFVSDLNRALSVQCELDFMRLKSYVIQPMSPAIHVTMASFVRPVALDMYPNSTNAVLIHPNVSIILQILQHQFLIHE